MGVSLLYQKPSSLWLWLLDSGLSRADGSYVIMKRSGWLDWIVLVWMRWMKLVVIRRLIYVVRSAIVVFDWVVFKWLKGKESSKKEMGSQLNAKIS